MSGQVVGLAECHSCAFSRRMVQEKSALYSTSFIARSSTITETGDPIVLLVFTCAVYSIIYVCTYVLYTTD